MSQHLNAVPMEADLYGELLERPGCYEFEPIDGTGPRRVLSSLLSPPSHVDGTVMTGVTSELEAYALSEELSLPESEGLPEILREFGDRAFRQKAEAAHGHGHKLLGGLATYETNRGPQSGLFISRRMILEMSFSTMNAGLAPNSYPRYDVPPHPKYGRHAPPEVRALAMQIPIRDQESVRQISYLLTRDSIVSALKEAVNRRNSTSEALLQLVPRQEPDPIAA